jgi:hypothetical protein
MTSKHRAERRRAAREATRPDPGSTYSATPAVGFRCPLCRGVVFGTYMPAATLWCPEHGHVRQIVPHRLLAVRREARKREARTR